VIPYSSAFPAEIVSEKSPAVFVLMTINTEVFPVRSVRRVMQAVSVFMVYGKKMPVFQIELTPAFGADESVDLQGLLPVP
jgi:hypothetical protein